jgi:hypothetical protein
MPPHRQAFAPGDVRLRRLSVGFVCRQGMLEQTFGWCRPAGGAEHVYEGAQRRPALSFISPNLPGRKPL